VNALRGRFINAADDINGGPFVVVLGHNLWQDQFGGDKRIVGKALTLAGNSYTVIGVMPAGFASPQDNAEAWTPVHVSNPVAANVRGVHFLRTYARLAPEFTLQQARAGMAVIDRQLADRYPADDKNRKTTLLPLKQRVVGDSTGTLLVLFAAVSLVLMIACANFANLLLARASGRTREIVVRSALGAGRGRLMRQLLTESVLISLSGGVVGALIAWAGTRLLVVFRPERLPRLDQVGVDWRVFAFTAGVSLLTGLVFGLFPAWSAARAGVCDGLKESARGATAARTRQRVRSMLIVAELATALVLLIGAGLLVKTFWQLRNIDPGFKPDHLLTMRVELPEARYPDLARQTRFRRDVLDAVDSVSGAHAALISEVPLGGESLNHDFLIDGWPPVAPGDEPSLETRSVLGDYFKVMQIPLRAGRAFESHDLVDNAPLVGIVNEAMVRKYFPDSDPLGKRVRWARLEQVEWITIVGVVGDVRHFGLDLAEQPALYSPYTQAPPWKRWMTLVARTAADPAATAQAIKRQIWKLDAGLPVTKVRSMSEVAAGSLAARRFNMLLLALFAAVAMLLSAVGIYGVIAYAVVQRTQELGIRMALGAGMADVVGLVMRGGLLLALIGLAVGLAGAFALTRLMTDMLFAVAPTDAMTITVMSLGLLATALFACWLPARRAARLDPIVALRHE
jgi:putative ABC transport system permease protein